MPHWLMGELRQQEEAAGLKAFHRPFLGAFLGGEESVAVQALFSCPLRKEPRSSERSKKKMVETEAQKTQYQLPV